MKWPPPRACHQQSGRDKACAATYVPTNPEASARRRNTTRHSRPHQTHGRAHQQSTPDKAATVTHQPGDHHPRVQRHRALKARTSTTAATRARRSPPESHQPRPLLYRAAANSAPSRYRTNSRTALRPARLAPIVLADGP
ncbi:hypothetical protein GCM10010178_17900 [Lentzea flava]|uniref:Uncharacterized protein n=1 Tax=Lentzea flava TaxID=103732 RepID=A0ABQ2UGL6_9PSEU|nr:hypothetical protein GCM10010178_17900 [Lentzea flava]